jgi:uncharacterized protein (DUF58 family)
MFLAASTAQAGWLFVLAAGVLGLVVGSLFVRHRLSQAEISRSVPARTRVGDEVRVGLEIENKGSRSLPLMRLEDHFEAFEPIAIASEPLGPGSVARLELVRQAQRRGAFTSGGVHLRAGAPFGFVTTRRTVDVASSLIVVPRWVELRSFPILEPSSFPSDILHERARTGAGEEYLGVREYRPGDPPRAVHWRSTARRGQLVVREFEEEVASRVTLVVAGPDSGTPPDSAFEALVSAAASIAIYAIATGHPVELVRAGDDGAVERLSQPDRYSLLDWLAHAKPSDVDPRTLVAPLLGRGWRRSTVVLLGTTSGITGGLLSETSRVVQSAGSRSIVVAALSSTWADTGSKATDDGLEEFKGGRAPVRTIAKGEDLVRCLG